MQRFLDVGGNGKPFDLIVIGGGITGAAVAYDAACRGLSVALLEKRDFGWATSAATSKLIHGGLRYLANFELRLVRESLRERRILENIAPNLVYPLPFLIPNYDRFKNNRWVIKAGMVLYDLLSFDKGWTWDPAKRLPCHRSLSRRMALDTEPSLRTEGLTGAAIYHDCQSIAPERLTLAFVRSAAEQGAAVANYAEVIGFLLDPGGRIIGVRVRDRLHDREHELRSALTVNCGGPWADVVLERARQREGGAGHTIRRSEGIHLITRRLTRQCAVTALTARGRHLFFIPWRGHTLIGTTDKEYQGHPDDYRVTRQSIEELLGEANATLSGERLGYADILLAYGGLRPLVEEQVEGTYASSRRYEIYDNERDGLPGLLTVEGGKYTTSRNLAAQVCERVGKKLGRRLPRPVTARQHLHGCTIPDLQAFLAEAQESYRGRFAPTTIDYLSRHYGTAYPDVLRLAEKDPALAEPLTADGEILAEVVYAITHELAYHLDDIVFRRTGLGTLRHPGAEVLRQSGERAAALLGWDGARLAEEIARVEQALRLPE